MTIPQAVGIGVGADKPFKNLTSSREVGAGQIVVSNTLGATDGAIAAGSLVVVAGTAGLVVSAPVTVPLAVAPGVCGFVPNLFGA